jgi:hypothetical protein
MSKLLLLAFSMLLVTLWLVTAPVEAPTPISHRAARPAPARRAPAPFTLASASAASAVTLSDPSYLKGEALAHRLDDEIPTELYAQAAHCYHGGLPPEQRDQRLDVTYRLHVSNGEVSVTEAGVTSGTLGDGALQRCIVDRVLGYAVHDVRMPDLDEEGEVFLRVGGFKPFLAQVADDGDEPPHL